MKKKQPKLSLNREVLTLLEQGWESEDAKLVAGGSDTRLFCSTPVCPLK